MGRRTSYAAGTPSWVDLATSDVDGARRFYGAVFGWGFREAPEITYTFCEQDGAAVAGLQPLMDEALAAGAPPHWSMYVHVEDADATAARVAELGGTVVAEPFPIPGAGRMAVVADPQGGIVLLWQPAEFAGAGVVNAPGAWAWSDLQTTDPEGAAPFYAALLGWEIAEVPGSGGLYRSVSLAGRSIGGIMRAQRPIAQPYWAVYLGVADVEETLARIAAEGGRTLVEPMPVPSGRFAVAMDPQGAAFGLVDGEFAD
ncbi:MAG: Glyoxalase/bleomycin resistance protein/dioxygenase [Conexibacter sp.]|nr:Glyoxalase/bleomycin resistance protein/dioxygenase [Conexibacter sp.]